MVTNIFLAIIGIFRLATGIALIRLAAQRKLSNLNWLAAGFLITVIDMPFTAQPYIPFVDKTFSYFAYLCYAIFIVRTFYRDKRSPFIPFWTVFTLLYLSMYGLTAAFMQRTTGVGFPEHIFMARPNYTTVPVESYENIDSIIYGVLQISIWLWHAVAGWQARQAIAADYQVEDWVKGRYQLVIIYSVLQSLVGIFMILRVVVSEAMVIVLSLLIVSTTMMQFLTWVMPEGLRRWLNRNQAANNQELVHTRALSVLDIIGGSIADNTGIAKMITLFAIRKYIGDQLNTEDQHKIETRVLEMGYQDWQSLLNNPDFYAFARHTNTKANLMEIQEKAKNVLIEKQALFTMQSR